MKTCSGCKIEKSLEDFYVSKEGKFGRHSKCKACFSQKAKVNYQKNKNRIKARVNDYYWDNREYKLEYAKEFRIANPEKVALVKHISYEKNKDYYLEQNKINFELNKPARLAQQKNYRDEHKEQKAAYDREYRQNNRDMLAAKQKEYHSNPEVRARINENNRNRAKNDPWFRIRRALSRRTVIAFKNASIGKESSAMDLIDCTGEELVARLKSTFHDCARTGQKMTMENYGHKGWHIDHIVPCAAFDLTDIDQQRQCFHWSNLQALWWWENLEKSDKIK